MATESAQDVTVEDVPERNRFEIRRGSELAGFAEYRKDPGQWVFTHTEIDPEQQGRGLAGQLVGHALDAAKAERVRVVPSCSYVAHFIDTHPAYAELVDQRADDTR